MTWVAEHAVGIGWAMCAWAFLVAVVGGALYRRWSRHEQEDAAETTRVMSSLKADHSHDHEQDAL
jgi:hypothetical protein